VLRSAVACLRHGRVLYGGAIAFEHPLAALPDIDGYAVPAAPPSEQCRGREDATPRTI
jgi:hypothetical protein